MLDWNQFRKLPGDARLNFEKLWRQLVGCRYGGYGVFREYKNMSGVEFVLELVQDCDALGRRGDKIGWQCKFPDRLELDGSISADTKRKFIESLRKCRVRLTRCFLCCQATSIHGDDKTWISEKSKEFDLSLEWQIEEHLESLFASVDNGAILKESYFGNLVLDRKELANALELSIAPVSHRYIPDVIGKTLVEEQLRHKLLERTAWDRDVPVVPEHVWYNQGKDERYARIVAALEWVGSKRRLAEERGEKYKGMLNWHLEVCRSVRQDAIACVGTFLIGVMADAGCGKTCLGISICKEIPGGRPAGAFFLARELKDGDLDSLAHTYKFRGRRANSMDEVLSILNTVGQSYSCKMPLVIDGLNESRNPAEWQSILSRLVSQVDRDYPHVLVIVTFRSGRVAGQRYNVYQNAVSDGLREAYIELCMPKQRDGSRYPVLELTRWDAQLMSPRYFSYYKIETDETTLPDVLCHPLSLSIYCLSENRERRVTKHVAQLPRLMANIFDSYVVMVAKNIVLQKAEYNITPDDVKRAIVAIGSAFLNSGRRYVRETDLRAAIEKANLAYSIDWRRVFSEEGLIVENVIAGEQLLECTYDALGGYLIAEYLLTHDVISDEWSRNELADDIAASLLMLYASRNNGAYIRERFPRVDRCVFAKHVVKLSENISGGWAEAEVIYAARTDSAVLGSAIDRCLNNLYEDNQLYGVRLLDTLLRPMKSAERDSTWGRRVLAYQEKWGVLWKESIERDDDNLILCKWLLSSTCITVRDRATHILHNIGIRKPKSVFDAIIDSLAINDAYILERMAAVGYGVAMCLNIEGEKHSRLIIDYAERIIETSLKRNAPCPCSHKWVLDALVNTVALAKYVARSHKSKILHGFRIPYKTWYNPFKCYCGIDKVVMDMVERAFDHDFKYYRLPHLIGEFNYKTGSAEYRRTKAKIAQRMYDLGYRSADFENDDRRMVDYSRHYGYVQDGYCYEPVGKKYASIAYAEMEPWAKKVNRRALVFVEDRLNKRLIRDYARGLRSYWTPYFWPKNEKFPLPLPELVVGRECGMPRWLSEGGIPDVDSILSGDIFGDGHEWILLHGFVEQEREGKYRVSHRTDGVLTTLDGIQRIEAKGAENTDYNPREYNETVYWEFPWSRQCTWNPNTGDVYGYAFIPNVQGDVEIPYCSVSTGSRNEPSREDVSRFAYLPDLHVIRTLGLKPSSADLNWYDSNGKVATRFYCKPGRFNREDLDDYQLLYIRRDLLEKYVRIRGLKFIQRCFGERYPGMALVDEDINYSSKTGITYQEKEFAYIRRPIGDVPTIETGVEAANRVIAQCSNIKVVVDVGGVCMRDNEQEDDSFSIWPSGRFAADDIMFKESSAAKFYGCLTSDKDKFIQARVLFLRDKRSVFVLNDGLRSLDASLKKSLVVALRTMLKYPKSSLWYVSWLTKKLYSYIRAKYRQVRDRNKRPLSEIPFSLDDLCVPTDEAVNGASRD